MRQQSSSTPQVPSMPSEAAVPTVAAPPASAPNLNSELKAEGSSSNSFILVPLALPARNKEATETNGEKQHTEKKKKEKENLPKAISSSSESTEKKHLKNSGALNLSASVASLDSASVIDVRRLRTYLSEGKRAWLDEFRAANGLSRLVEVAEQALKDQSGKRTPLLTEALECLRVWPTERVVRFNPPPIACSSSAE